MADPILVVGAGWSGAVIADRLAAAGQRVEVVERERVVGGHSRFGRKRGVVYEPHGPHILHTDKVHVATYLRRLGLCERPFAFCPLTEIDLGDELRFMSWPVQLEELEALPDWPRIDAELAALPPHPSGDDFESYAVSLMGRRLYEYFVEGYTRKQWGRPPSELSSSFAPKRIDLRRDGNRRLFRDAWEFFPGELVNRAIERLLRSAAVTLDAEVTIADIEGGRHAAVVITAALDDLLGRPGALAWRGVESRARFHDVGYDRAVTPAYVINRPHLRVPYTRTVETKWATGQRVSGTVVCEEHPGAAARHYPVATVERTEDRLLASLTAEVVARLEPTPVAFAGRLATYRYLNQDEAIEQALATAATLLQELSCARSS